MPPDWYECEHEWDTAPGDWDAPEDVEHVKCKKCDCPGERYARTDAVYWPTT